MNKVDTDDIAAAPDWDRFDHPQRLFALAHPQRWPRVAPVSDGAALSCRSANGNVLMEVLCFSRAAPKANHLVDAVVEGLVKFAAHEDGMSGGRVISVNQFDFGGAERCIDVLVAFLDASGTEISVDYFVVGTSTTGLYVALKTPTASYAENLPDFERVLGTLRAPWLQAKSAPDLSAGGHRHTGTAGAQRRGLAPVLIVLASWSGLT